MKPGIRTKLGAIGGAAVLFCGAAAMDDAAAAPWPLGTYISTASQPPSVPAGFTASGFTVSAPGVTNNARGWLAVAPYTSPQPQGVALFFSGGGGTSWWSEQAAGTIPMTRVLRARGFTVLQVRWQDNWLESFPGNEAGTAHLGARPATVINHVHQSYYAPLIITAPAPGQAGFAVVGHSGGASAATYALSHFGLDQILDLVVTDGGPPHAALAKSMMNNPDEQAYWYPLSTRQFVDRGFGFFDGNGPAARQDPSFIPRWLEESHATGGDDYFHPATRVHFLTGELDPQMQIVAGDYRDRLAGAGSPLLNWQIVPGTPHLVISTTTGRDAMMSALTQGTRVPLGDANYDGRVNLLDFNILAANFGQTNRTWRQGDFTGDLRVDLTDFNALAGNFGFVGAGPEVSPAEWSVLASAVPEPLWAANLPVAAWLATARRRAGRATCNSLANSV